MFFLPSPFTIGHEGSPRRPDREAERMIQRNNGRPSGRLFRSGRRRHCRTPVPGIRPLL